ncbi:HET-domain-containing protein, partial [Amniculicola lignicola CBS 123094]
MRLVHSTTLCLIEFGEADIPPYAILSHRWGKDEISFQDMSCPNADRKAGYQKIKDFCRTAAEDGFEYVWVDTCCIDKTNSSELSEAINSMYRWYKDSEVCYAYLSDVDSGEDPHAPDSSFSRSRWFSRGWTLQELIAPSIVMFYGSGWKEIGTNSSLRDVIEAVTGIHAAAFLGDHKDLRYFSIAQRMSWAANRKTTRTEDLAYCLLGLFDISMPMLYGEGEGAFIRLQEEIIKVSDDPTIFAWRSNSVWDWNGGLLARSPSCFRNSRSIVRSDDSNTPSFALTNKGLRIQLPLYEFDK